MTHRCRTVPQRTVPGARTMRRSHALICLAALGGSWAAFDQCERPIGAWAGFDQVVAEPPFSLCVHPRECANA